MRLIVFLLLLALASSALAAAPAERPWNQFRGPDGTGHTDAKGLPLTFADDGKSVKWKTPITGKAWSSPVMWGDDIWLTNATPDGKKMWAMCVDFATGAVKHNVLVFENEKPQFCHDMNSYGTPTPVVEDGRVYVHFGVHGTACLDTKSGKTIWSRRDLKCDHFRGPASSPIVDGNKLYILFDGFDVQYAVALNKNTGETIWKTDRAFDFKTGNGDNKKAYCTPAVIEHDGKRMLIAPAAVATEAFDPDTGKLLWTVRTGGMNASARPIYGHGLLFVTNGMGRITVVKPQITKDGGEVPKENIAWEAGKAIPKKSSPLLIGELLYMVSDEGVASCVNAKTGDLVWSQRMPGGTLDYAASPIYSTTDNRIYAFSRGGDVFVLEAGKQFKVIAQGKIGDGFMASPAIKGKAMILRSKSALYRIED